MKDLCLHWICVVCMSMSVRERKWESMCFSIEHFKIVKTLFITSFPNLSSFYHREKYFVYWYETGYLSIIVKVWIICWYTLCRKNYSVRTNASEMYWRPVWVYSGLWSDYHLSKNCHWLDSNPGPLVSLVTDLPTLPQSKKYFFVEDQFF